MIAFPLIVPSLFSLKFSIVAERGPPVEMLAAPTLIMAFEPIVPPPWPKPPRVVRNFEQPGALRTDIAADTDVNDRTAVDRTAAEPVTVSVVYSEARVTARSGEIAAKIEK